MKSKKQTIVGSKKSEIRFKKTAVLLLAGALICSVLAAFLSYGLEMLLGIAAICIAIHTVYLAYEKFINYNVLDTATNPLPFYGTLTALGFSGLKLVYVITAFIAVLSTAVGFSFGAVARYSKLYRKPDEEAPLKDGLLVVVLLLACAAASKIGIVKLVSTGYTILGYFNLPLLIFPAIVLATKKIQKKYLKENNVEAPGVDE